MMLYACFVLTPPLFAIGTHNYASEGPHPVGDWTHGWSTGLK